MDPMMDWHIASTLPRQEPHVVQELRGMGFRAVCPSYRRREIVGGSRRQWRGRARLMLVTVPAFPNYVMFSGAPWQRAQRADGLTTIIRVPGDRDSAAILPMPAAERLLGPNGDGLVADLCETVEALHRYLAGQRVTIISGLMQGKDGTVISSTHARVRILIAAMTEINVAANDVRAAQAVY